MLHAAVGCQDQARAAAGPGTFSASAELVVVVVVVVVSPSPLYGGDSLLTTHHRHHKMLDAPCAASISLVKCEVCTSYPSIPRTSSAKLAPHPHPHNCTMYLYL